MTRVRQAAQLLLPVARTGEWTPLFIAVFSGAVFVFIETRAGCILSESGVPCLPDSTRVQALRVAAVLLAVGVSFILDDPCHDTTQHLPTPRWLSILLRIGIGAPLVAAGWLLESKLALRSLAPEQAVPVGALTIEMAALAIVGLAAAAASVRIVRGGRGGVGAACAVLAIVGIALVLPGTLRLFLKDQLEQGWARSHVVWMAILGAAAFVFIVLLRDPAAPRPMRWPGARAGRHVVGQASRGRQVQSEVSSRLHPAGRTGDRRPSP